MTPQEEALIESAVIGDIDGVRAALAAGADIHATQDGALRSAALNNHAEMVNLLLAAGANVHADHDGAMRWAAYHGHVDVVRVLLASGVDPVAAWSLMPRRDRRRIAATFDTCADAMTHQQRAMLASMSPLLAGLRVNARALQRHQRLVR